MLLIFLSNTGVYRHHTDKKHESHSIRLLGWGVDNGDPYWLLANSWGTEWGDNGFIKVLRGSNECEIENRVVFGTPKIS